MEQTFTIERDASLLHRSMQDGGAVRITLTPEEIRAAHEAYEAVLRMEDARQAVTNYLELNGIDGRMLPERFEESIEKELEAMCREFVNRHDCNQAENDAWEMLLQEHIEPILLRHWITVLAENIDSICPCKAYQKNTLERSLLTQVRLAVLWHGSQERPPADGILSCFDRSLKYYFWPLYNILRDNIWEDQEYKGYLIRWASGICPDAQGLESMHISELKACLREKGGTP